MKKLFLLVFLIVGSASHAQEGVEVSGNTLRTREIPPVWPGCEGNETQKRTCFKQKLVEHLKENYKYPRDEQGQIIRGKAVVSFEVDEEGKIQILKVEGPNQALNEEAKRIINAIPQMTPGKRAGKPVAIQYRVPFTF